MVEAIQRYSPAPCRGTILLIVVLAPHLHHWAALAG
jgi:hypothetical protein